MDSKISDKIIEEIDTLSDQLEQMRTLQNDSSCQEIDTRLEKIQKTQPQLAEDLKHEFASLQEQAYKVEKKLILHIQMMKEMTPVLESANDGQMDINHVGNNKRLVVRSKIKKLKREFKHFFAREQRFRNRVTYIEDMIVVISTILSKMIMLIKSQLLKE